MTHTHLLGLLGQPALITATAYTAAKQLILARIAGQPQAVREGTGPCGEEVEMPQMVIENGIAVIPVAGILGWKLSGMEKGSGCTDYSDIIEDIEVASADPTVTTIVFDIDSPGGAFAALQYARFAIEHPADLWATLKTTFSDKLPHAAEQGERIVAIVREKGLTTPGACLETLVAARDALNLAAYAGIEDLRNGAIV
jgi:hypothetical protein